MTTAHTTAHPILPRYRKQIVRITQQHGGLRPRIFGSRAVAAATPTSDLDLLVEMASGRDLLDLVAMKQDLEDLLGGSVDVVTERSLSPYLRTRVLREARPL